MRSRGLAVAALVALLASCAGEIETPGEALRIFGNSLPRAYLGERYEAQIRAVGGLRPFNYQLQQGELPPGLDLEAGVISGMPSETGSFDFTIGVSDANLSRTFQDYSLEVVERPPPLLTLIAPETEIRSPVTVRLQVENATRLRAFTTVVSWDAASFDLLADSVDSTAAGAALVLRDEPGRLHLEMAALGNPWNGEVTLAQFTLVPNGTVTLQSSVEALFIDDTGATHFQGAPGGAEGSQPGAETAGPTDENGTPVEPQDDADDEQPADEQPADDDPGARDRAGDGPAGEGTP